MAKIITFPKKYEPKTEIEMLIRKWLDERSANSGLIEYVIERMKDFIDNYTTKWFEPTFNLSVPPNLTQEETEALLSSIEKGVGNTAEEVREMINKIIIERFLLEIEIYESRKNE